MLYWALTHGFTYAEKKEDIKENTFTTLIGDMGQFYSITFYFKVFNKRYEKVTFIDSLKIIPFKVEDVAKSFNLSISKLKIDYNKERERGHILTEEEKEYIKNDVVIMSRALKVLFDENLKRMTIGSNAVFDFKKTVTKSKFEHLFPELTYDVDKDLRKAYKGGFTYLNPIYKEKDIGEGVVLDVNSLYPSVMYEKPLPFGEPVFFDGKYNEDKVYSLYVQMITCSFEIKKNKIPTIQIKNNLNYKGNEYLTSSNGEIVCLVLSSIDLKLFIEHYNISDLNYVCGWKFKAITGVFKNYIDKWIERKNEGTKTGNLGQRTLAKLMLNSLYRKICFLLRQSKKISNFR